MRRAVRRFEPDVAGAGTALLLYDRYFPGLQSGPVSDTAGFFPASVCGSARLIGPTELHSARLHAHARRFGAVRQNCNRMNGLSKGAVHWLTVDDDAAGQRIDNFLTRILKGVPKSHIYRMLRTGEVRINKRRAAAETRLATGDVVRIPPVRQSERPLAVRPPKTAAPFRVIFEDDAIVAVDKPAGVAVHGGSGIAYGVIEQLRASSDAKFLELVHRLDRDTSGVLLLAKKRPALIALHDALRNGRFDKRYFVLARGEWRETRRIVDVPLHKFVTREGERRVRVQPTGREAQTVFYRRQVWRGRQPPLALLEAELRTGRTHQIRVHLAHLGFPIAGDGKYGDFSWNKALARDGLRRMFLHAWKLAFVHPLTGEYVALESPLPSDLTDYLLKLDADAAS